MKVTIAVQRMGKSMVAARMKSLEALAHRKAAAGVLAAAKVLYDASQKEVPRDTNYLAETGRYYSGEDPIGPFAVVGYGGVDWPPRYNLMSKTGRVVTRYPWLYAIQQHQVPQNHDAGQKDHYLSDPCSTAMSDMRLAFLAAAASVQ